MTESAERVICATCQHWQLRHSPEHARLGLAPCALDRRGAGHFWAMRSSCPRHAGLPADAVAKRLTWLDRQRHGAHERGD